MPDVTEPTLSVVVVTKNEAENVDACLRSIFELCRGRRDVEVILVDSNSTDDSVARAAEYPITVLQIPSDELASPGAGRFVGTEYASGEYLLFVDGDMRLETDWLDEAFAALEQPDVAGVTGLLDDSAGETATPTATRDVDALRGVALYQRGALEAVGGFDPFLAASEDVDVGFRLAADGKRLVQLPVIVASHRTEESLGEPLRRWRHGYYHGVGQAVRKSTDAPTVLGRHLVSLRHPLVVTGWALLGMALLAIHPTRRGTLAWTGLTVAAVGGYAARESPRQLVVDGCSYLLTAVGLFLGGLDRPAARDTYPLDRIELVKEGSGELPAT